jgi:hypothetical protein
MLQQYRPFRIVYLLHEEAFERVGVFILQIGSNLLEGLSVGLNAHYRDGNAVFASCSHGFLLFFNTSVGEYQRAD